MDWTKLAVDGRVTTLQRGICAGVTAEGAAFVARLHLPHERATTYDDLLVDSFGVFGVATGDRTRLTGRGADGRLHVWWADDEGGPADPHSLHAVGAVWAAPVHDARRDHLLTCHLDAGAWRLRVHDHESAVTGGRSLVGDLAVAGDPDTSLVFGFHRGGPLVVAGQVGDSGRPSAWSLGEGVEGWRRIHLAPTPTALTSVATSGDGRRTWVGGTAHGRPAVYEVLRLPFRGRLRSTSVTVPALALTDPPWGRALVLVDEVAGGRPVFVASLERGNRLCWHDGTEWKALPAPDGPLRAACASGGAVHVLLGCEVWSVEDPTGV
jgi:hypothetical protein